MQKEKTLYLIDGHALVYRSHYAFIRHPLINSKGLNTSAIAGFVRTLWDIIKNKKPDYIAVVFDPEGPTFRHEEYPLYKANRDKQPEDIAVAIPIIKDILKAFNIPVIVVDNYEADDVIGTIAKKVSKQGIKVYMVTPDKDYGQLVDENIYIFKPLGRGEGHEILGLEEIKQKWEVEDPRQVIDILALQGDASDNIPGVRGIGEKGAKKLIKQFGSLENIYENLDEIKGKIKEYLINSKENAFLSKHLATIKTDVPLEFSLEDMKWKDYDKKKVAEIFKELEFRTLAKSILEEGNHKKEVIQTSLFGDDKPSSASEDTYQLASKNYKNSNKQYFLVDKKEEMESLVANLKKAGEFAFDVETSQLNPNLADLVGMSFAYEKDKAYYVPVDESNLDEVLSIFKPVLEDPDTTIITGQNIKYDMLVMKWLGVEIKGKLFDTMIAHYLLEPEQRHKLDYLAEAYLGYKMISIEELIGKKGKGQLSMKNIDINIVKDYAAEDADITFQLKSILEEKLKEEELMPVFENIEIPLIEVLCQMEYNGVFVDKELLKEYSAVLEKAIKEKEQEIYREAGVEFNIASPKQVGEVLFEKLHLPYRWKKTGTGQYSTSEEKLSELAVKYDIVAKILEYRKLQKLKNTYVDTLPKLINPRTGRIHSSFNQARTATGRLSSENPNLQNIPIKDEAGREIRKAFKPQSDDYLILSADYSQIELRLIADMAEEKSMLEAFEQDLDIHRATAAKIFGVPIEQVTPEQRRQAKTINFSIIYGAGATNLARQLGISRTEAKKLIDNYFKQYSGLQRYFDEIIRFAREHGYVTTKMGRKRKLRDINSRNSLARSNAERMAINTPIQGTAADMIKIAMNNIHREMIKNGMKSKMIMQVHDELVFEVHKDEKEALKNIVVDKMTNAIPGLKVKIKVDTGIGNNWLEAH